MDQRTASRIAFVDIGRALAAIVVVLVHIDAHFLRDNYGALPVPAAVDSVVREPLGLGPFGLGEIAVGVFFLISGYVVTPIALKLGMRRFAVNRLFRVYPLMIVVVLLSVAALAAGLWPLAGPEPAITLKQVLANLTLVNFVTEPNHTYVAVAWTLAVEVLFYLLLIAVLPLLRWSVWIAITVELELIAVVVLLGNIAPAMHLVVPVIGQVLWAGLNRRIPGWLAGVFLAVGWTLIVVSADDQAKVYWELSPAPIALAVLLFLVGVGMESRLRPHAGWTALSERSYSIYLVHGLVTLPALFALDRYLPLPLALLIGVGVTALAVQVSYVLVERPSHALGRKLSRRSVS